MSAYLSNRAFFRRFPDDDACLAELLRLRFGEAPACPKCGRALRRPRLPGYPAFGCPRCGHHLHPMAGTPFAGTRVPLQYWFYAVYLVAQARRIVPARTLQRALGVSAPTARRMARTLERCAAALPDYAPRPALGEGDLLDLLRLVGAAPAASAPSSRSKRARSASDGFRSAKRSIAPRRRASARALSYSDPDSSPILKVNF